MLLGSCMLNFKLEVLVTLFQLLLGNRMENCCVTDFSWGGTIHHFIPELELIKERVAPMSNLMSQWVFRRLLTGIWVRSNLVKEEVTQKQLHH